MFARGAFPSVKEGSLGGIEAAGVVEDPNGVAGFTNGQRIVFCHGTFALNGNVREL